MLLHSLRRQRDRSLARLNKAIASAKKANGGSNSNSSSDSDDDDDFGGDDSGSGGGGSGGGGYSSTTRRRRGQKGRGKTKLNEGEDTRNVLAFMKNCALCERQCSLGAMNHRYV